MMEQVRILIDLQAVMSEARRLEEEKRKIPLEVADLGGDGGDEGLDHAGAIHDGTLIGHVGFGVAAGSSWYEVKSEKSER